MPETSAGPSERIGFIDAPEIGPPNIASSPIVPPIAIAAASPTARVSVEFTHEVADGMHGAIVKARKTNEPARKGLPLVQPAASAGCC